MFIYDFTNLKILNRISNDVQNIDQEFKSSWALIITWDSIINDKSLKNTYQLTLTTGGIRSFAIFDYISLTWDEYGSSKSRAFYDAGNGEDYKLLDGSFTPEILKLSINSNVGIPGKWIFRVDESSVKKPKPKK